MSDKDTTGLAHKALDAALTEARSGAQTGTVAVVVSVREGTPNGIPKVETALTASTK